MKSYEQFPRYVTSIGSDHTKFYTTRSSELGHSSLPMHVTKFAFAFNNGQTSNVFSTFEIRGMFQTPFVEC